MDNETLPVLKKQINTLAAGYDHLDRVIKPSEVLTRIISPSIKNPSHHIQPSGSCPPSGRWAY